MDTLCLAATDSSGHTYSVAQPFFVPAKHG